MNIGILGTGMVGQAIGGKLSELGHNVTIGTRDVAGTLAKTERTPMGMPPYSAWQKEHPNVLLATFADAAAFGELLFNCTSGMVSLEVLKLAGEKNLGSKILVDVSNPLDVSKGIPPSLSVCNTDSLGELIQRTFPALKVVKALNTTNATVMVNPRSVANGDHSLFICGNDVEAKRAVKDLLASFGWNLDHVLDLGDITNARGTEMILPLWVRLYGLFQSPMFQFKIVR
jgi:predicted dinucleotide-binding enzyme